MIYLAEFSVINPDPGLLFWTVVIFLLVWIILGKFAFKPIASALKSREDSIDSALKAAEEAKLEMKRLTAQNEQILIEAREERATMLKESKQAGERIVAEAKEKAKEESSKLIAQAKQEIQNQKVAAIAEVKNQAGQMAVDIAGRLVKQELKGGKEQDALVASLIEESILG